MSRFHVTDDGPKPCHDNTGRCPYAKAGYEHFTSIKEAQKSFEKMNEDSVVVSASRKDELLKPIHIKPADNIEEKIRDFHKSVYMFPDSKPNPEYIENLTSFYRTVLNGEIPDELPLPLDKDFSNRAVGYSLHSHLTENGMWARATKKVAEDLAANIGDGVVLDPMAGKGYLAKSLREAGVKTIASDDNSWKVSEDIENLDAIEAVKKYGSKVSHIVLAWVPYGSDADLKILQLVRKDFPHITIINIGEHQGGCTGSESFWDEADEVGQEPYVEYRTTYGINDFVAFVK